MGGGESEIGRRRTSGSRIGGTSRIGGGEEKGVVRSLGFSWSKGSVGVLRGESSVRAGELLTDSGGSIGIGSGVESGSWESSICVTSWLSQSKRSC